MHGREAASTCWLLCVYPWLETHLNLPPNSCMPSSAKMTMKRKRRNNSEMIDRIEFINERTNCNYFDRSTGASTTLTLRRLAQCLVNLNTRNSRMARSTEMPKLPPFTSAHTTSKALPTMTAQSKRLNLEAKYVWGPTKQFECHKRSQIASKFDYHSYFVQLWLQNLPPPSRSCTNQSNTSIVASRAAGLR